MSEIPSTASQPATTRPEIQPAAGAPIAVVRLEQCAFSWERSAAAEPQIERVYAVVLRHDRSSSTVLLLIRSAPDLPGEKKGNYYHLPGGELLPGEEAGAGLQRLFGEQ